MINIHAREITDELTSLVSQLDKIVSPATPAGRAGSTHSFVVFLTDDPDETTTLYLVDALVDAPERPSRLGIAREVASSQFGYMRSYLARQMGFR